MTQLPVEPREKLIVALDFDSLAKANPYIEALAPYVGYFKVGLELINAAGAPAVVHQIQRMGGHIFFDGKFCDIPNTV
ncbi:orotidine 5'-phosphate decarboxylase / HUMPS family protein, partial [Acetobacter lovaniensis]|uniref:orotidine 5'-phosphate decarboxylase / HUMPS family protein n=1 Tax=Acetobacter lovaniensis TaxID=104100 RepID=UPI0037705A0A